MSFPRYSYSNNIKNDLLQYLKASNEAKNSVYCDFKEFELVKSNFPLGNEIKQDLKVYMERENVCIDITQSDDETEDNSNVIKISDNIQFTQEIDSVLANSLEKLNQTNIDDIIESIKDNLNTQCSVSSFIIKDLSSLSPESLEKVFCCLADGLGTEDVVNLWNSLIANNHINNLILCYIRFLLLPRAIQEFTYKIEAILLSMSQKYATDLKNELINKFFELDLMDNETNRVILQYIGALHNDYKTDVLRHFLKNCEKLQKKYILIIEALINPQTDYDVLAKVIDIMSKSVTEFSTDNAYGKLLFNVVNLLEKETANLEQPLKHILGVHRSIWKIKVQKVFVNLFDNTLTQSFV